MACASPKPFSITYAPSDAKRSAMALPISCVEPVTSAVFPASCLSMFSPAARDRALLSDALASLVRNGGRGPQHIDVEDAVLNVRSRRRGKPQRAVELLQLRLRRDADGLPRPELF